MLRIAVPNKGSLSAASSQLLADAGYNARREAAELVITDVDGAPIVFPIGPNLSFSWADCETQTEQENNRLYRCELKPGYVFK